MCIRDRTLDAGETCTVGARFEPVANGPHTGTLTATAGPGGSATSNLSGTGADPAQLSVTPATHDYGRQVIGSTSGAQTLTVTNTGGVPSGAVTTGRTGPDLSDFPVSGDTCNSQSLAAGGTCTVDVSFQPAAAGDREAALTVSAVAAGGDQSDLSGEGITPANLTVTPARRDFGDVAVGDFEDQVFTIRNTGQQTTGTMGQVFGVGNGSFNSPDWTCVGNELDLNETCTVTVRFEPSDAEFDESSFRISATPGGSIEAEYTGTGTE